ncbi:rhodanese-like domain-containing protein [Paenibacillus sp. OAS669]|uniref:rhodanese-like domain-containing protein n=1 Tax=Paenibacillus sp. OAS669 TaxID=2663821 RepID=UPI0019DB638E|nr:rhodanese-like domain-containing protein [Paenibacillus sp. OAS669]MBE1445765.1 rhodanese-related sulfurtransferase [Paenibacillus sp. OAS669]
MDVYLMIRMAVGVKGLRNLSTEQFREALQKNRNNVLIDVREPNEVKRGYIPGAVNIPLSQFKLRGGEIPAGKSIYLYCQSGMRSKQAARILQKKGFRELAHLQGGIMAWNGKLSK